MRPAVSFVLFPGIVYAICVAAETPKEYQIGYVAISFCLLTMGICDYLREQLKRREKEGEKTARMIEKGESKTAVELLEMRQGLVIVIEQIQALHQELENIRGTKGAP